MELPAYLRNIWDVLASNSVDGVYGALEFKGPVAGPTVGITLMTHGNEPAGLAAVDYFLRKNPLQDLLQKGRVVFLINNLEASQRFWDAKSEDEIKATRFVDVNMNRLPSRSLSGPTSEEQRVCELLPVWATFDYALDIHSTVQPTRPMVILGTGPEVENLCRGFDMETVLGNILNVQLGFPAISFYGHAKTSTLGVEVGGHYLEQSLQRAIQTTAEFLKVLGMIADIPEDLAYRREFHEMYLYRVHDKLVLTHEDSQLARVFIDFEDVAAGELLAIESGVEHRMRKAGHVLFGPPQTQIIYRGEEALFLLEPKVLMR